MVGFALVAFDCIVMYMFSANQRAGGDFACVLYPKVDIIIINSQIVPARVVIKVVNDSQVVRPLLSARCWPCAIASVHRVGGTWARVDYVPGFAKGWPPAVG